VAAGPASPERALVAAAHEGDEAAFRRLTEPYARELHVHCYRMLGSIHDAEDAFQETMLRAWRHVGSFQGRSLFRAWLYRIATNVCLAAVARRPPDPPMENPYPATPEGEATMLAPYPDALLDELPSTTPEPDVRYDLRESVQLAFLASVQHLPPRQRAVLLLRDVLGFAAIEVAELLEASPASVNSALQRARATLDRRHADGRLGVGRTAPPGDVERSLVERYADAWESVDVARLVALLREDVLMTMPPAPLLFRGRQAIGDFFLTVPAGGALDEIRLLPTRANRQPALAGYVLDREAGVYRAYGIMVLTLDRDAIAEITGFSDPSLFPLFGLPPELDG
jgi:RNA polymerase sigma-70 factor (TIGR02960 family)